MGWADDYRAELEAEGANAVRLKVQAHLIPSPHIGVALQWLGEKDAEAARQAEACRTHEALTARQAKITAARVNAALIAITTLGLIVATLAWLFPRR